MLSEEALRALVGHRFPGGTYTIAHWENFLLTDCTRRSQLADGLVHPIALFHVPIQGVGTSIGELFELGDGSGEAGSIKLVGYDWEYLQPLREGVDYRVEGGVLSAERLFDVERDQTHDDLRFSIELTDPGDALAARVTNHWRFWR